MDLNLRKERSCGVRRSKGSGKEVENCSLIEMQSNNFLVAQVAEFCTVNDLVSLAHTCQGLHQEISRFRHWKCDSQRDGVECNVYIFQGEGSPSGCDNCLRRVCPACTDYCENCGEVKCSECDLLRCEACDSLNCVDCMSLCCESLCSCAFCLDCYQNASLPCGDCGRYFCSIHGAILNLEASNQFHCGECALTEGSQVAASGQHFCSRDLGDPRIRS